MEDWIPEGKLWSARLVLFGGYCMRCWSKKPLRFFP